MCFAEVGIGAAAGAVEGVIELMKEMALRGFLGVCGDVGPLAPAYGDAGEGLGDLEAVPGASGPGVLGFEVEAADGGLADLGELDGAGLGLVDGAARAVGGEDGGGSLFEDVAESDQAFAASAGAGAADGAVAEALEGASDELAVKGLADEDGGVGAAEVEGAGEDALMPEAVDFTRRGEAVEGWGDAVFGEDFKTPGAAEGLEENPDEAGDDGEGEALGDGEGPLARLGHGFILVVGDWWSVVGGRWSDKATADSLRE